MSTQMHTPPDGWDWVRAKLKKCCPELTLKARTESIQGTPWEVMGWMHILCSYAQAANRTYVHIAVEQEKRAVEAERQRDKLLDALQSITDMTNADNPESYRSDDREGCFDTVYAVARDAVAEVKGAT